MMGLAYSRFCRSRRSELSETRIHPETGEKLSRDIRPFTVRYGGRERVVQLPGWYPAKKGAEGVHIGEDMEVVDRAIVELKAEVQGVLKPDEVRAIRLRLKLSQRKAGEILGGGPRAFQKYESGEVLVSRPMTQLLRLLSGDPRRLKELVRRSAA
jgi:HTH-type transcriptional regulator/antitoxin MqsA